MLLIFKYSSLVFNTVLDAVQYPTDLDLCIALKLIIITVV